MTHQERIRRDLEAHPGSTYEDITRRTGIGSPHRRITGKESPKTWTLRMEQHGKLFLHYADPKPSGVVEGLGLQGARAPGPGVEHGAGSLDGPALPEATDDEVNAALAKLGLERPRALA